MLTLIAFIIILGFLVFVHEIGHFLVARRNGIKADEFGFGFPPRAIGIYKDDDKKKWKIIKGNVEVVSKNTIYSLNWIPIGGFVKIKGENGDGKFDHDSFANKSPWVRTKVLAAGVAMNIVFAWILFSFAFMIGVPQSATNDIQNAQVLIQGVDQNSPAERMGLKGGDVINSRQIIDGKVVEIKSISDLQNLINEKRNQQLTLSVSRGKSQLQLTGTPNETDGKGKLGIALASVYTKKYGFFAAFREGFIEIKNVFIMLGEMIGRLFQGDKTGVDVTGIVGIAIFTGQVIPLGFAYILRFAAILSVNLAIVNAFPIPALDGGRILFILIEKIKGSPVSHEIEQKFHTIGFALLMLLMVVVTYRDFIKFDILDKIKGIF